MQCPVSRWNDNSGPQPLRSQCIPLRIHTFLLRFALLWFIAFSGGQKRSVDVNKCKNSITHKCHTLRIVIGFGYSSVSYCFVKSSQKYLIWVNAQSYHTTLDRLKPIWAYLSHCVMNLHKICDYLFIDQRVHFNMLSLFIDSLGFHSGCRVRWNRYMRSTWKQHITWFINRHSHNKLENNFHAWNDYNKDLFFNQIVAKLLLEDVYRLNIFYLIWQGIPHICSMYDDTEFSDI